MQEYTGREGNRFYVRNALTGQQINLDDMMLLMARETVESLPPDVEDTSFRHITFQGHNFVFGPIQAKIVRQLYRAGLHGHPWQHGQRVLEKAGSESFKFKNMFARQRLWRRLIISDGRGMFRLHPDFVYREW